MVGMIKGFYTSFKYLFKRAVTVNYPKKEARVSDNYRGQLVLLSDGSCERCVACKLCEAICPAKAIKVEVQIVNSKRSAKLYRIDMSKCIYCGLCVKSCPASAIVHTKNYKFATGNRPDLIYNKEDLLKLGRKWKT